MAGGGQPAAGAGSTAITTPPSSDAAGAPPVSRRGFLASAGLAAAAPMIVPATVLGRGRVAASDRLTVALIGCGGMGNANVNSMLGHEEVQVVAVCDPDRSRREITRERLDARDDGRGAGCVAYADFRECLDHPDLDAVIQATPDHWHALVVIAAARAGKDVYGEKPLSLTIEEGRAMAEAVRTSGRVFQTGSQQRSDARFHRACELVRSGRIGTVRRVVCGLPTTPTTGNHRPEPVPEGFDYDLWLGPAPWAPYCSARTHWNFRWILDYSGGQVTDWGAHHIDIAHWGLGLGRTGPVEVAGVGDFPADGLWDAATNFRFTARYATGVEIEITNAVRNGVRFEGDDGWIFVTRGAIEASPAALLEEPLGSADVRLTRSPGHHRDFLDCVRSRREPIAPIEEAHRTITVAHLGNVAMQLGRPVRWDPETERFPGDPAAERLARRAMRGDWSL